MLIDSNIIIYAAKPEHADFCASSSQTNAPAVSAVSVVEVPSGHQLTTADRQHFEEFSPRPRFFPLSNAGPKQAIKLRQIKKLTLGDLPIAGTAVGSLPHARDFPGNVKDFDWIAGLTLLKPFTTQDAFARALTIRLAIGWRPWYDAGVALLPAFRGLSHEKVAPCGSLAAFLPRQEPNIAQPAWRR